MKYLWAAMLLETLGFGTIVGLAIRMCIEPASADWLGLPTTIIVVALAALMMTMDTY